MATEWIGSKDADRLFETAMTLGIAKDVIARRGDFDIPAIEGAVPTTATALIATAEQDLARGDTALYLAAVDRMTAVLNTMLDEGSP